MRLRTLLAWWRWLLIIAYAAAGRRSPPPPLIATMTRGCQRCRAARLPSGAAMTASVARPTTWPELMPLDATGRPRSSWRRTTSAATPSRSACCCGRSRRAGRRRLVRPRLQQAAAVAAVRKVTSGCARASSSAARRSRGRSWRRGVGADAARAADGGGQTRDGGGGTAGTSGCDWWSERRNVYSWRANCYPNHCPAGGGEAISPPMPRTILPSRDVARADDAIVPEVLAHLVGREAAARAHVAERQHLGGDGARGDRRAAASELADGLGDAVTLGDGDVAVEGGGDLHRGEDDAHRLAVLLGAEDVELRRRREHQRVADRRRRLGVGELQ